MRSNLVNKAEVIIIAPAWPNNTGGYGIAMRASLLLYLAYFSKVHFICISDQPFDDAKAWPADRIEWTHIPIENSPIWARFLRSLAGFLPAVTVRYSRARKDVMRSMHSVVDESAETPYLIIEDVPTACLMRDIVHKFSEITVAVRSHNMTEKAYGYLCNVGTTIHRLAWRLEISRIKRYEKNVCEQVDRFWTISREDSDEYIKRLSVQPDGVIGICMDTERYQDVGMGDAKTVVNVGTADLRKGKGLSTFIQRVWPKVRAQVSDARFVLAGRRTERFADADLNVEGLGFVEDDRDVLGQGLIFVNPQQMGTGVQLKSIVAMLAGKALVSTPTGVEGIEGRNGEHFIAVEPFDEMASRIVFLIRNSEHTRRIGQQARELATKTYSAKRFIKDKSPLLDAFARKASKGDK